VNSQIVYTSTFDGRPEDNGRVDAVAWLLESEEPAVRGMVRRDLLG
jgi:hypothetical protein